MTEGPQKETDLLRYQGHGVPRFIRFIWTLMIIFGVYYLSRYMWPDLQEWLQKSK
jgi:hypothetical protein